MRIIARLKTLNILKRDGKAMSRSEIEQVLKVLSVAIKRETTAFNYYSRGSENLSLPQGVRGLLSRLAEEERGHRHLLTNEYQAIERGWDDSEQSGSDLSYAIPQKPSFIPLDVSDDLETAAVSLPAVLVGGDNILSTIIKEHDLEDRGTFLLLYDVMGHSIETTHINALAAKTMGEYVETSCSAKMEMELLSPGKVVRLLNGKINEIFEGQGVFLTLMCMLFNSNTGMLKYTLAGHEPPFLIRENGKAGSLLDTQLIVGIDSDFYYRENMVSFERGDTLCIFSDGIVEARNADGDFFGRRKIAKILESNRGTPPRKIVNEILVKLNEFIGSIPLTDEITIVIITSKGG